MIIMTHQRVAVYMGKVMINQWIWELSEKKCSNWLLRPSKDPSGGIISKMAFILELT